MRKIIILILVFLFLGIAFANQAKAGSQDNVSGWAWSENIGWISFNCTNQGSCATVDYGVNIGSDGILSGYAWSENIGWISFNQADLSGCPSGTCRAEVDLATGEVSGWARALSYGGGWDGWIHLRGSSYGVSIDFSTSPKEFEGWAWGGEVIGWISFNCDNPETGNVCSTSNYKVQVSFSFPPTATNLNVEPKNYCSIPVQYFSWTFDDPDPLDTQGAYRLQVDKQGDWVIGNGEFDSGKVYSSSQTTQVLVTPDSQLNKLDYNTHYYWRLRVWDNLDTASTDWIYGPEFNTEPHMYPDPDFTWSPSSPTQNEIIQFCSTQEAGSCPQDVSTCYDINNNPISCSGKSFLWTFPSETEFATGSSATSENPRVKFLSPGSYSVTLKITDDVGSCSQTKEINVGIQLPRWREVAP
jgi:hypothetical protein